jgi:uncharacterized protein (TIGR00299 family) protein
MRCAYFDCFCGAAGDMILAALVDAGLDPQVLHDAIARLGLPGVTLQTERVRRGGLAATHVSVNVGPESGHHHRRLPDILKLIAQAGLAAKVSSQATRVFERLAAAEAGVHGIPVEQVHFHEVGAADAIVDIVGACAGIAALDLATIVCSPIPTGSGTVRCEHGVLPVPAPATAELLRGVPLAACDEPGELTTPTAAAILTTLASSYGPLPPMRIDRVGYGAGTREGRTRPNLLRLLVGELAAPPSGEENRVTVLETQVDDATGQNLAYAVAQLLDAGALDAFLVPIFMKKGRPGQLLTVLARSEQVAALEDILFRETTTFGVRRHECQRRTLVREHATVATPFGPIRVKVGRRGGQAVQAWPEFEDCAAAATKSSVPLRTVQDAALRAWAEQHDPRQSGSH